MLKGALWQSRSPAWIAAWTLARAIPQGTILEKLDPNHARTQAEHPEGVVMVPLAVCGDAHDDSSEQRDAVRDAGAAIEPARVPARKRATLSRQTRDLDGVLVTRVLFEDGAKRPRAIGVSYRKGQRLYRAHKNPSDAAGDDGIASSSRPAAR